jgi:hypothetical protein
MTRLVSETLRDIRNGRETWRVLLFLGGIALSLAVIASLIQQP